MRLNIHNPSQPHVRIRHKRSWCWPDRTEAGHGREESEIVIKGQSRSKILPADFEQCKFLAYMFRTGHLLEFALFLLTEHGFHQIVS